MSIGLMHGTVTSPFAPAHEVLDGLAAADLSCWESAELLEVWRELERVRNRLAAVEHRFVAEAERQGLPWDFGAANCVALVRGLLRVDPHEAAARVRAADAAASRLTLTGEPTPAPFPEIAAAQAAGVISPRHARVIVAAVTRLPDAVQVTHGAQVEHDLVALAGQFDPFELAKLALRMTTLLDPDGAQDNGKRRERDRDLTVHQRPDGSSTIRGEATVELTERLLTMFDALAAPKPAQDGVKDSRTPGQRRHDALLDALNLVQRAELLPHVAGISTTVLLTTTVDHWANGTGTCSTGHGAVVATRDAIRMAGGDARVMTVTLDPDGGIVDWTDARRFFTEGQRLVMVARDGGCSVPGCDAPPAWCQAHHVDEHTRGGPTAVGNGALV